MNSSDFHNRASLERFQIDALNALLSQVLAENRFYRDRLGTDTLQVESLEALRELPLTSKDDLNSRCDSEGLAPHHTYPLDRYVRFHRTSGSTGRPIQILDTKEDWDSWLRCWGYILDQANVVGGDIIFTAFSFGPFIGFWSAYDACLARGCRVIPAGGLSTVARLDLMRSSHASVLLATPTYAMHLADVAESRDIDLKQFAIRKIIVAGECGGSVATIRQRLEQSFDAKVIDHSGATEVGAWGFGLLDGSGIAIIETEFIAEYLPLKQFTLNRSQAQISDNSKLYELVLTNLYRTGAPAIRYRTGDVVQLQEDMDPSNTLGYPFRILDGGILGRVDQMVTIRGVNVFPSSVEAIVRRFDRSCEFRVIAERENAMDRLALQIEEGRIDQKPLADALQLGLGLKIEIELVAVGSLETFAEKSRRFIDRRS